MEVEGRWKGRWEVNWHGTSWPGVLPSSHNLHPLTPLFLSASSKRKKEEAMDLNFLQDHKHLIKTMDPLLPPAQLCASNTMCHMIPAGPRPVEGSWADSSRSWLHRLPGSVPSHSTFSLFKITYSKELMCLEIDSLQRLIVGLLFGFYS